MALYLPGIVMDVAEASGKYAEKLQFTTYGQDDLILLGKAEGRGY